MIRPRRFTVLLRVLTAALVGTIAGIHLDLWESQGYRHIPAIGSLFLLNGIAGALLAIASLTLPRWVLPLAWLVSAGYAAVTLGALLISLDGGLLGFTETTGAPLLTPSLVVEAAAVLTGIAAGVWQADFRPLIRRPAGTAGRCR